MHNDSPQKTSPKMLKALLKLAEEHELNLLEFNSVKILRGGPPSRARMAAMQKAEQRQARGVSGFPDDYPETVESMDQALEKKLRGMM